MTTLLISFSVPIDLADLAPSLETTDLILLLDFRVYLSMGGNCLLLLLFTKFGTGLRTFITFSYLVSSVENCIVFSDLTFFVLILKEDVVVF